MLYSVWDEKSTYLPSLKNIWEVILAEFVFVRHLSNLPSLFCPFIAPGILPQIVLIFSAASTISYDSEVKKETDFPPPIIFPPDTTTG